VWLRGGEGGEREREEEDEATKDLAECEFSREMVELGCK
jgi:hypothetical protein